MTLDRLRWKPLLDALGVLCAVSLSALSAGAPVIWLYAIWGRFPDGGTAWFATVMGGWLAVLAISLLVVCIRFPSLGTKWVTGCLLSIPASPVLIGSFGIPLGVVFGIGGQILWLTVVMRNDKDVPLNICRTCGYNREGLRRCPECGKP